MAFFSGPITILNRLLTPILLTDHATGVFTVKFNTITKSLEKIDTDCLVIPVWNENDLGEIGKELSGVTQGQIETLLKEGNLASKSGSSLLLHHVHGLKAKRVLLVRVGSKETFTATVFRKALTQWADTVLDLPAKAVTFILPHVKNDQQPLEWIYREATQKLIQQSYRFNTLKADAPLASTIETISFYLPKDISTAKVEENIRLGEAIGNGMLFTRHLGDLPGNICTPTYLADQAKTLAKKSRQLKVKVLEESAIKKLGMLSFLSVTRGSIEPPKLIVLEYNGLKNKDKPIVLVGKGITFDTGGISIKPRENMDDMKYDMSGAGTILGIFDALAALNLPLNVVGIIPTCENMPSGSATKPGDIVKSMSGQTIEILNTDAEGRLILCDALTYAKNFNPALVIDLATLTGACIIALGRVASGLFSHDDKLSAELLRAGEMTGDRAWRMPLFDEYQEQLDSAFADMANIGGPAAGSITAASFLARFTKDYPWAHLDIAGTADKVGAIPKCPKARGATGRPIPMLMEFLLQQSALKKVG